MNELSSIKREISLCEELKDVQRLLLKFKIHSLYSFSKFYDIAYKGDRGDKQYYQKVVKDGFCPLYVGFGTGRIFAELWKVNPRIEGIDKSIEMINGMLQTYPYINTQQLILGDILKYKFKKNFETIIAPFSFLTQFEFKDSLKIAKSIYRTLSNGGVFCSDFYSPYDVPNKSNIQVGPIVKNKSFGSYFMVYCYSDNNKRLTEFTIVNSNNKILVLELKLFSYYPKDILRLFEMAGFSKIVISRGFSKQDKIIRSAPIVVRAYKLGKKTKK